MTSRRRETKHHPMTGLQQTISLCCMGQSHLAPRLVGTVGQGEGSSTLGLTNTIVLVITPIPYVILVQRILSQPSR
jgi:hypothetical protein